MDENNKVFDLTSLRIEARLLVTDKCIQNSSILQIGESNIATIGNFSASTGKAKSKKTFNVTAIVAAAMVNGNVLKYHAELPIDKKRILYIDTEQSAYHCQKILIRILKLAGLPQDKHPENLEFLVLRKYSPKVRAQIIEKAIYDTKELGLVIIDGVRDLAYDINSPSEATDLISKLMQWTDERKIHIHTVLHMNKSDENTRGHLGTELNNKAETILQVVKDKFNKDISSVSAMCVREKDFEPFAFRINEEEIPVLTTECTYSDKKPTRSINFQEMSDEQHCDILETIFLGDTLPYGKLIDCLQDGYKQIGHSFGKNKTKELKLYLEHKGMIVQAGKCYNYNEEYVF